MAAFSPLVHKATIALLRARTSAGPLWVLRPAEAAAATARDIEQIKIVADRLGLALSETGGGITA